ncbi:hypothetical protein BASA50_001090 [Batrachochytrium salamandrivorans]|uniref:Mitochondrial distribution and morphology protein 34 n=1 Tax=Batrachochytrium salamandrivorans TaxID=1357716 RepID=A0ABQ8ESM5_9FUNG|nr:hypothetical protein BASA62_003565 [Batrachochytrium salamandrivorans]KAH6580534.1 hypothetical protein BASA60_002819 [Batrachochytrium salamandrivorans]KAH6585481.1 hypothetical protein BASA50_001090 [Batrachochytrium salamandrivorans]KAH6591161.1 hypothetical protein BASA61_005061 [Batrachochytrium salamandrivorans]KAH9265495.1 hypothetical protein BASA83_011090 [Batrachochytrium salamandrivorans]
MSFKINWPEFSGEFLDQAKEQLSIALNNGGMPGNIVDRIIVKELDMGTKPPDLEILEIGELAEDRFKGIFKLSYSGDAFIIIKTRVQANPLTTPSRHRTLNVRNTMLNAQQPFIVPMEVRISNVKLRGIIVLVVDKERGVTLVFKNDPLERVDVNSTFDNIPNIRRFLQAQIESQLRSLFKDDLPQMVHNLSLVLLSKQAAESARKQAAANMPGKYSSRRSRSSSYGYDNGYDFNGNQNASPGSSSRYYDASVYSEENVDSNHLNRHVHTRAGTHGYEGEYRQRYNSMSPSHRDGGVTHQQKWSGNEPAEKNGYTSDHDSENGYVLYRSLSQTGHPDTPELGLNHFFLQGQNKGVDGGRTPSSKLPRSSKESNGLGSARSDDRNDMASVSAALSGLTVNPALNVDITPEVSSNVQFHYPPHLAAGSTAHIGLSGEYHWQAAYGRPFFAPPPSSVMSGFQSVHGQNFSSPPLGPDASSRSSLHMYQQYQQILQSRIREGATAFSELASTAGMNHDHSCSAMSESSAVPDAEDHLSVQSPPAVTETSHMYRQGQVPNGTVWRRPVHGLDRHHLAPPPQRYPTSRRSLAGSEFSWSQRDGTNGNRQMPVSPPSHSDDYLPHRQQQTYTNHERLNRNGRHAQASSDYSNGDGSESHHRSHSDPPNFVTPLPSHTLRYNRQSSPVRRGDRRNSEWYHCEQHQQQHSQQGYDNHGKEPRYSTGSPDEYASNRSRQSAESSRVVLQPSDNEVAAHLANLMSSNHTISPYTHDLEHYTYRAATSTIGGGHGHSGSAGHATRHTAAPTRRGSGHILTSPSHAYSPPMSHDALETRSMSGLSATSTGFSYSGSRYVKRRAIARTVRIIRVPSDIIVPGLTSRSGSMIREGGLGNCSSANSNAGSNSDLRSGRRHGRSASNLSSGDAPHTSSRSTHEAP